MQGHIFFKFFFKKACLITRTVNVGGRKLDRLTSLTAKQRYSVQLSVLGPLNSQALPRIIDQQKYNYLPRHIVSSLKLH